MRVKSTDSGEVKWALKEGSNSSEDRILRVPSEKVFI